jgi:beta-lactamase superfamily II metal-dependent hydrolase
MKSMKGIFAGIFVLLIAQVCFADYLITNRKTSVKQGPSSESGVLLQIEEGTRLELMDNGTQTNWYYKVRSSLFMGDGWIYRTFVRRYASDISSTLVGNVEVRVVDVGPGLCNLIKLPDNRYIIYDAGHWRPSTIGQIADFIPAGSTIELMVLSHTDADHIGAAAEILETYTVRKVLWTGFERSMVSSLDPSGSYTKLVTQLRNRPHVKNINLNERDSTITPGTSLTFGNVRLTFLCGFGKPLPSWGLTESSLKLNAVSIVMKLEYGTNSILFTGDAVGRHIGGPDSELIATEHFLVTTAASFLPSRIVIAPHHGADNGSSTEFIKRTNPETVIFSAGSKDDWQHPRQSTADRYLNNGVRLINMFRTDRGDDEGNAEWSYMRISGCNDEFRDDDIQVELRADGTYSVYYLNSTDPCSSND